MNGDKISTRGQGLEEVHPHPAVKSSEAMRAGSRNSTIGPASIVAWTGKRPARRAEAMKSDCLCHLNIPTQDL